MFEKKKIFVFSAARFIISKWLMTRNYPDIITYAFCKKRVVTQNILDLWDPFFLLPQVQLLWELSSSF
jgi:membrane-bound acyltransferase YfiQ involved in biofilm formation